MAPFNSCSCEAELTSCKLTLTCPADPVHGIRALRLTSEKREDPYEQSIVHPIPSM